MDLEKAMTQGSEDSGPHRSLDDVQQRCVKPFISMKSLNDGRVFERKDNAWLKCVGELTINSQYGEIFRCPFS